jgi:hypothetical protein
MEVFQTCGLPPARGSTIFPTIGWTRKRSAAAVKIAAVKSGARTRDFT